MKLEFSRKIFKKKNFFWNTKFIKNPSSGNKVVRGQNKNARMDMTKLIVAFCDFAKATKIWILTFKIY
jgi:hypothetical protein